MKIEQFSSVILFGVMGLFVLYGCIKDKSIFDSFIEQSITFAVIDEDGTDLLNPQNETGINTDEIEIYYKTIHGTELVYNGNMAAPKFYTLYEKDSNYYITVFLNHQDTPDYSTTYVKWTDYHIDTLDVKYMRGIRSTKNRIVELFVNKKLSYPNKASKDDFITLVK